jgi:hypothetical protein
LVTEKKRKKRGGGGGGEEIKSKNKCKRKSRIKMHPLVKQINTLHTEKDGRKNVYPGNPKIVFTKLRT